jgi:hypothetical protein
MRNVPEKIPDIKYTVSPNGKYLTCENRIYNYSAEFGTSHGYIKCGFCGTITKVFIWSLAGSGKKCRCGAKHTCGLTAMNISDVKMSHFY